MSSLPRAPSSLSSSFLVLYRHLLKEANNFSDYNFREFALRKIKLRFRSPSFNPTEDTYKQCEEQLEQLRRMTTLDRLYSKGESVISVKHKHTRGQQQPQQPSK